ncbi:Proline iminopeptidase [Pleurostoma richardsiae]|uniref:Carboxylic ester hydrolase n=1 Tax=Pleurostoma richardsiae TaxID=41990 RepID=A0AA38RAE6_9PEZI|nr:Proline iminopeptidase [Pleurostoma richardsiae]
MLPVWLRLYLWLLTASAVGVEAQDLVAALDYGTFQGAYSAKYNISYWQKIPFAAPPVGENRFRAPQPPLPITNGTYDSSQTFDMCVQRTVNGSEDCLYLGLYSRPWTASQPLRPVVVVFYGGGFIQGSASFTLPPSAYPVLNVSSSADLVFVYPNYRVNAFGFLPGRQVAADRAGSDLNPGLLDQDAAIRWTRAHVARFGGDPERVSIWGQSAGGGSVVAQVIAAAAARRGAGKRGERPFRGALASSPFWPKTYRYDSPEAQAVYDMFATAAGCAPPASSGDEDEEDTSLACLKRADVQTLRDAALLVSGSHTYNTSSYTWGPVIDGRFLTTPLSRVDPGDVDVEVGFGMYNTHEGENFIPPGLKAAADTGTPPFNSSAASFAAWLRGFLPGLSACDLQRARRLYPSEGGSTETIAEYDGQYARAGLVFRDVVLACPAYWMAGAAPAGSWLGEYSIDPAKHASDTYWVGNQWNQVNSAQQTDPFHYEGYTGAFASFFMTGDPNALKLTAANVTGVPALATGEEFNINSEGFASLKLTQFKSRCDFWRSVAPKIPI